VAPLALAAIFAASSVGHVVATDAYASIVPPALPAPQALVYLSGAAELACAAGLCLRRTRSAAGWASAALLVAVFPANVQMALDAGGTSPLYSAAVWGRLPLQVPLVALAVYVARTWGRAGAAHSPPESENRRDRGTAGFDRR